MYMRTRHKGEKRLDEGHVEGCSSAVAAATMRDNEYIKSKKKQGSDANSYITHSRYCSPNSSIRD
jgi:hypothetical protein